MNVNSYPLIIDGWSVGRLEREIKMFYPLLGNHWIGRYDEPENTIEKYIQDCYSMYYEEKYPTAQGFEWWFHVFTTEDRGIGFHSDHDETIVRARWYDEVSFEIYYYLHQRSKPQSYYHS